MTILATPDPSNNLICLLHSLEDHLEHLKIKLIADQPWVYTYYDTTMQQRDLNNQHWSITDMLHYIFSDTMRMRTLDHLRTFNEGVSRFQSKFLDENTALVEDTYLLIPSLHVLLNLHYQDILHLPHYGAVSQSPFWSARLDEDMLQSRAAQVIPWLDRRDLSKPFRGAAGAINDLAWKPHTYEEQFAIASIGRAVRKAWEAILKSRSIADGLISTRPIGATLIKSPTPSEFKAEYHQSE